MSDRFVTIARYHDLIEPQIAKGVLEQHGILCQLVGEHHARTLSLPMVGLVSELRVLQSDAETARELLELDQPEQSTESCPVCGKHEVARGYSPLLAFVLETFFLPRAWLVSRRKCNACGYRWRNESPTNTESPS